MKRKTTKEAIKELETVDFMFPNSSLMPAYRLPHQLPNLGTTKLPNNSVNIKLQGEKNGKHDF